MHADCEAHCTPSISGTVTLSLVAGCPPGPVTVERNEDSSVLPTANTLQVDCSHAARKGRNRVNHEKPKRPIRN